MDIELHVKTALLLKMWYTDYQLTGSTNLIWTWHADIWGQPYWYK